MGTYGYEKNTTPFLDSLFQKGAVFENAITPGYLTFQTDAAIFSSLYPSENNVMTWSTPINDKIYILPQILHIYGFDTAAFVSPSLWEYFGWSKQFQSG
jgi:arylsulfatase A-like enzyme